MILGTSYLIIMVGFQSMFQDFFQEIFLLQIGFPNRGWDFVRLDGCTSNG